MVEGLAYPRLTSVGYPLSRLLSSCVAACPSGAKRLCVLVPTSQAGKDSRVVCRTTAGAACNRRLPPTVVNSETCPCVDGVAAAGLCPPRLPPPDRQGGVPSPPLVGDAGGVLPGPLLAEAADALFCWAGAAFVGALA